MFDVSRSTGISTNLFNIAVSSIGAKMFEGLPLPYTIRPLRPNCFQPSSCVGVAPAIRTLEWNEAQAPQLEIDMV